MPFIVLYFAIRYAAHHTYRAFFEERLGHLPAAFERTPPNSIWLHAVSAGEIVSATPLIRLLRSQRSDIPLYVSTSTIAGRRAAEHHLKDVACGIFYAPLDFGTIVRRTLRVIRPALLIVFETEIWPTLYFETKGSGTALAVVNGRISNKTWPRYRQLAWFFAPILRLADAIFAQTETDAQRYRSLGVDEVRLHIEGNLKYDVAASSPVAREVFGAEQVWIAASTAGPNERGSLEKHEVDEDDIVIATFMKLAPKFPRLLLVLAPRQPARFDTVAEKLEIAQVSFVRRSANPQSLPLPGVLLLDTMGELAGWYHSATVAFVGGSLAPRGGHNVLEPAAAGVPVITGPHTANFEAIVSDLLNAGALLQISREQELEPVVTDLLTHPEKARSIGEAGRMLVHGKTGVAARIAGCLWSLYDGSSRRTPHPLWVSSLYGALSRRWLSEADRRRTRAETERASKPPLPAPVISIGAVTIGGAGKTPLANQLSRRLREQGWTPAILTRGYRRRSTAEYIVAGPRTPLLPPAYTGDEAQIFLRARQAAVGIGSDRYTTAKLLLERFPETNVLILDDGFQHATMPRDVDILVIDGMDPWGGEAAVPAGRLREPLELLQKASVFVVTRAGEDYRYDAIRKRLRQIGGDIPVFRAHTIAVGWRSAKDWEPIDIRVGKTAAFCGLGNPDNFWRTLDHLGINPVFRWNFPDHHHYRLLEIDGLLQAARTNGVRYLLTTEKDAYNLPESTATKAGGVQIAWLKIELVIEEEQQFLTTILAKLPPR